MGHRHHFHGAARGLAASLITVAERKGLGKKTISVAVTGREEEERRSPKPPPPKPIARPAAPSSAAPPKAEPRRRRAQGGAAPVVTNLAMSQRRPRRRPRHRPARAARGAGRRRRADQGRLGHLRGAHAAHPRGPARPARDAPCEEEPTKPSPSSRRPIDYTLYPQAQADGIEGKFKARHHRGRQRRGRGRRGPRASIDPGFDAAIEAALSAGGSSRRWRAASPSRAAPSVHREVRARRLATERMRRAARRSCRALAVRCSPPASRLARAPGASAEGPTVTKPPKLVKFVPAVYPEGQARRRASPLEVLLSIEIGDDGKVGEVEVVKGAGRPTSTPPRVAAAKQFVFEPAEIDDQPAPVKITYRYDFTILEKMVKAGPADQLRRRGAGAAARRRRCAQVSVKIIELDGVTRADRRRRGTSRSSTSRPATYKVELSHPKLITVVTDEDDRQPASGAP